MKKILCLASLIASTFISTNSFANDSLITISGVVELRSTTTLSYDGIEVCRFRNTRPRESFRSCSFEFPSGVNQLTIILDSNSDERMFVGARGSADQSICEEDSVENTPDRCTIYNTGNAQNIFFETTDNADDDD